MRLATLAIALTLLPAIPSPAQNPAPTDISPLPEDATEKERARNAYRIAQIAVDWLNPHSLEAWIALAAMDQNVADLAIKRARSELPQMTIHFPPTPYPRAEIPYYDYPTTLRSVERLLELHRSPTNQLAQLLVDADSKTSAAAISLFLKYQDEIDANDLAREIVKGGHQVPSEVSKHLQTDHVDFCSFILDMVLKSEPQAAAAVDLARKIGPQKGSRRDSLIPLLFSTNPHSHEAAAIFLDRQDLLKIDGLWSMVNDLGNNEPHTRSRAARQLANSNLLPEKVAQTLVKATDERDFAVREGLLHAIPKALRNQTQVEAELKEIADSDRIPARRAYAKAALRAINN